MSTRQLHTFADAEEALQVYIPVVKEMTGKDITLERMQPLMAKLGNPEKRLKVIHVAGTSGKTSTAYYLAGLLKASGHTVGLTVSPHIDVISERVQVNLEPLPEAVFCSALSELLELVEDIEPMPSYFELLMAMAYWFFDKIGVDYAVIETGFGGLHDASNICSNANKVCVLTDIGFDHMHILGKTLPDISRQKAGIMHSGNKAFTFEQPSEIPKIFQGYAQKVGADVQIVNETQEMESMVSNAAFTSLPLFQQRNWLLAHAAYAYVAKRDGFDTESLDQLEVSLKTYIPGRMDVVRVGETNIVMDGAHNEQKITALVASFQKTFPGRRIPVLLGMKTGKEYEAVLPLLKPIASQLIVTTFNINQDLRSRPIEPHIIAEQARKDGFMKVTIEPDTKLALDMLLQDSDDTALVTGSFYLVANARKIIGAL